MIDNTIENKRKTRYNINSIFIERWSPRAMTGESITDETLMSLFEAARWAPSSFNNQPWRFLFAKKDTPNWNIFFNLLTEGNRAWAKNAAVLVVIISRKNFEYNKKPSITHQFDTGAAWENLALEASIKGIVAHGMQGFDYDKARKDLEIPSDFDVMAMIAIGIRGSPENLPLNLQEKEFPNDRKELAEIVMEGRYSNNKNNK
ncbi:nitroreductase family protein [Candidatus Nitrosocosmicus agrestis]|uniref:nitroreductase family protein n=1 Tax=Candidatus Nitrosocosmicus agrestis TaxID=2563600 RepID=UPI0019170581|nr:nitroreductase family protein [Candidatus Nitrosocosmicus sp. SS]MDR4489691.1 nitroreductase family protein [Candidatus Nitrosocosmicus sp.]